MIFSNNKDNFFSEIIRQGEDVILKFDCNNVEDIPSIEDSSLFMSKVIEKLAQTPNISKIVFSQKREYEYDYDQTKILVEIGIIYNKFIREKDAFSYKNLNLYNARLADQWYTELQNILYNTLKTDPLGAYVELKRIIRRETIMHERALDDDEVRARSRYISLLTYIQKNLEKTKLVAAAGPYLAGYDLTNRDIYRKIFSPLIKPDFMYTKIMAQYPKDAEEIASYIIGDNVEVTVFRLADSVQTLYHVIPPEFKLSEEKYEILDLARNILAEHKPKKSEFVDPKRMREVFLNVGKDLIEELSTYKGIKLKDKELTELTNILVRYTIGFGLIEVLLQDEDMQDVSVNSPFGSTPMFIVHGKFNDCITNIVPTKTEAESWASKLRLLSGRPLDEADPILDTELILPGANTRVSVISEPLDPTGLAFSFRRHRDKPWTLPLFVKYKTMTPLAAGLISFLVDGTRSMLIAGTRSSGKSSLLSSVMVEIMRRYRIITIEDTLELPSHQMMKLGFNIQNMKVSSALARDTGEMNASDGIRSTLRLGDSSLIVGEVRSTEAKALYEAMRVGAAANVVAGTIHGDSPYGVFDRVVNDIGVPKTSFKATDIIIIVNPIKSSDGLSKIRRVTQITEVRKTWENDPMTENGFVDLMRYDAKTDQLLPTDELINGDSEILKTIASNIPEFSGNWNALWEDILLRAKTKETLVNYSKTENNPDLLEAEFVIKANDMFHILTSKSKFENNSRDNDRLFFEWEEWLKKEMVKFTLAEKILKNG